MEWYVLNFSYAEGKVQKFNIFRSVRFKEGVDKLLHNFVTMDKFTEDLRNLLVYCFWCKREYEISAGDLHCQNLDKYIRVDVYDQIIPNLDILANYIINYSNEKMEADLESKKLIEDYMLND